MKLSGSDVHAIVVTFNPDWAILNTQLLLLNHQVTKIWVIDNASTEPLQSRLASVGLGERLQCIQLPGNFGLGIAQNVGIVHVTLVQLTC